MTEAAHILFPDDAPKPVQMPAYAQVERAAAEQRLMGQGGEKPGASQPDGPDDDAAAMIFKSEAPDIAAYEGAVSGEFEGYVVSAVKDGEPERAVELKAAIGGLASDFHKAGTDRAELVEALKIVKGDDMVLPSSDQIQADYNSRLQELPALGISNDDVRIAQKFISDLEVVSPGTKRSLELSGKGNDVRLIRMAIKEAKRRGYV